MVLLLASCSRQSGEQRPAGRTDTLAQPVVVPVFNPPQPGPSSYPPPKVIAVTGKAGAGTLQLPVVKPAEFYVTMQQYNTEQGLALSAVTCGYRDRKGYLWFGTGGGGVSRFDGKNFTTFSTVQGLASNTVWSIGEDNSGNMWFGTTGGGVSRYDGNTFTNYSTAQGLSSNVVYSIIQDRSGMLWFGTGGGGVSRFDGKEFTNFTTADGLAHNVVLCSAQDSSGNLWFGTYGGGVSRYDGTAFTNYATAQGLVFNVIRSIAVDRAGAVWFGSLGGGVSRYDGKSFANYNASQGLINNSIYCVAEDGEGNMWFGTVGGGACRFDGKTFTGFTTAQGLANNMVFSIVTDRTGGVWFGTLGGGICRYDGESLRSYTTSQGLVNNTIWSIGEDNDGNLWFGAAEGGITRYDGKSFANYTSAQGMSNKDVMCITRDRLGRLWFGTYGGGVMAFDGRTFTVYTTAQGLANNNVRCSAEDREGNIWFGTDGGGVSRFDGSVFTNFTVEHGLADNALWCITEDREGNMWFGTDGGGVSRYDGNRVDAMLRGKLAAGPDTRDLMMKDGRPVATFTNYSKAQGLAHNQVYNMTQDAEGHMWFGTAGGGVSRFDGKTFLTYSMLHGLPDDNAYSLKLDAKGDIVIGTNRGLTVLHGFIPAYGSKEPESAVPPSNKLSNNELRKYAPVWKVFNQNTGYPIKDINTNALYCGNNGILWAGTGDRLVRFDPGRVHASSEPMHISIQSIKINNTAVCWHELAAGKESGGRNMPGPGLIEEVMTFGAALTDAQRDTMRSRFSDISFDSVTRFLPLPVNLVLPYAHNNVTFDFAAVEPGRNSLVRYQYLLDGYDDTWSPVTDKTSASFGNINAGTYTFYLRARSPEGVWSKAIAYSFTVRPPVWRTWWMYSLYVLAFVSALWGFVKMRERSVRREHEILRASEERYRLIVETANEGVWHFDKKHRTIFANSRMCDMLGYSLDEMMGRTLADFMDSSEGDASSTFIQNGRMKVPASVELAFRTRDGRRIWVHAANSEMVNDAGQFTGALAMVTDITERKMAENQLNQYREHLEDLVQERTAELKEKNIQLDAANRSKSEFLANMSHEIRTPMNSIIGFSDILHSSLTDEKQRSQVDSIRSSGRTLLKIINDILDLSKIEAGKMTMQYEAVNVHSMAKELEVMFSQRMKEKGIAFVVNADGRIPKGLLLDETRLRQVLFNLVGNAVKFTDEGSITLSIRGVMKSETSMDLELSVRDTGIGIPQDQQELIFAPFTQQIGQRDKKYGGTGLGLTISQRLVEIMNGTIHLQSVVGVGSTFTITLPDVSIVEAALPAGKSMDKFASIVFEPATVLVVDDNLENRKFLTDLLEHTHLTLLQARDGMEAVSMAEARHPDLILMDIQMPVMNGLEAAAILKKQEKTRDVVIIATSASLMKGTDEKQYEELFDGFIMKPIDGSELLALLTRYFKVQPGGTEEPVAADVGSALPDTMEEKTGNLPELIRTLEEDFLPRYVEVSKRQIMGQIRSFGDDLAGVGERMSWGPLTEYGRSIRAYADQFQIDRMLQMLRCFPEFINGLKTRSEVQK
jgi:PAS domain S-box-containing protein